MTFSCLQCGFESASRVHYSQHIKDSHGGYDSVSRVADFHRATGLPQGKQPHIPVSIEGSGIEEMELDTLSRDLAKWASRLEERGTGLDSTRMLQARLMIKELGQVIDALIDGELYEVLEELCNLQYVLDSTFLTIGLEHLKEAAFQEVHRSNMSRAQKGDNFSPTRIRHMIK